MRTRGSMAVAACAGRRSLAVADVPVLVLRAAGINCDEEVVHCWRLAGAKPTLMHINRLAENRIPARAMPSVIPTCRNVATSAEAVPSRSLGADFIMLLLLGA